MSEIDLGNLVSDQQHSELFHLGNSDAIIFLVHCFRTKSLPQDLLKLTNTHTFKDKTLSGSSFMLCEAQKIYAFLVKAEMASLGFISTFSSNMASRITL